MPDSCVLCIECILKEPPRLDIARYLLLSGADAKATDKEGWSALHGTLMCFSVAYIHTLCECYADNSDRAVACKNGYYNGEIVRLLCKD